MQQRKASAVWHGTLKDGKGVFSTASGVLSQAAYSFGTRFENAAGSNPEELIAAAHAGCFSMALAGELVKRQLSPDQIETTATVRLENRDGDWTITAVHLDTLGRVPGADSRIFQEAAEAAKAGCPVSRVLKADISLDARLAG